MFSVDAPNSGMIFLLRRFLKALVTLYLLKFEKMAPCHDCSLQFDKQMFDIRCFVNRKFFFFIRLLQTISKLM